MLGTATSMKFGADLHHLDIMGQAPSAAEREEVRKASSTIFREDTIVRQVEVNREYELPTLSREDSWSMHCAYTDQAPYSNAKSYHGDSKMMTSTSMLHLPRGNASKELVDFLRRTGPPEPHRRPSKIEHPRRSISAPKHALKMLKLGGKRQAHTAQDRLNNVLLLRDEGGLLAGAEEPSTPKPLPRNVEQKVSSTGKKYLAVVPRPDLIDVEKTEPSILDPNILESRVSVVFHEEGAGNEDSLHNWLTTLTKQQAQHQASSPDPHRPAAFPDDAATQIARRCPTPVRPPASNPPSPIPGSSNSIAESDGTEEVDRPAASHFRDTTRALSSHPPHRHEPATPEISLPNEESPVKHPSPEKEVEIKHPAPRRFGNHPVLMQRASSLASTYPASSLCDSPGSPPPRSPLRLRRGPRRLETIVADRDGHERRVTPKIAPSIKSSRSDFDFDSKPIRATVTTECSGPIKRPKSRGKNGSPRRKEREERVRARKMRDRPSANGAIDSVVNEPAPTVRQKLKKMHPQIQIPNCNARPLRAPSTASRASGSSASSWRKFTQSTLTPVSPVPSEASDDDKMTYTPILPTASSPAKARDLPSDIEMSPVMLVAEEIPAPNTKSKPNPAKLVLKEGKPYAPRPRSASYARIAAKSRSRTSVNNSVENSNHSSPRSKSPRRHQTDDAPPLPSPPPPNRALPPTPPGSGSERISEGNSKAKITDGRKELSVVRSYDVSPVPSSLSKKDRFAHVATQKKPVASCSKAMSRAQSRMDARLEALEKQNALLQAALMAVLKTNGELNRGRPALHAVESEAPSMPMAWEARVARRSDAISRAPSSSSGSALDMYMRARAS
ncbi:hypothetical protein DOTSEDRAFT_49267 [Dothistroma septosporum NZE10]|uniref:Uncharacterized protein n=1 Tax=Dothistroma septosporum (strain NZE10 / CBS 128990) TaxID=675120 RepID=N1PZL8_DOTSN|nr:hypothetical protein DOTSEDRAFT_49267 [Dothistroma septosporum NZE10]